MRKTTVFCDACKQEIDGLGKEFEVKVTDIEKMIKDTYYIPMTMSLEICTSCIEIMKKDGTLFVDVASIRPPQLI